MEKFKFYIKWFLTSLIWLFPLLLILDIVTKWSFNNALVIGINSQGQAISNSITVIPNFFYFEVLYNKGAAWGSFSGKKALLVTISLVASLLIGGYLIWKWKKLSRFTKVCLLLCLSGAVGNFIDRAFYKEGVIDFIQFQFGNYVFPTFNLADSYLVIGVILFIISTFVDEFKEKNKEIDKEFDSQKVEENIKKAGLNEKIDNKEKTTLEDKKDE